MTWFVLQYHRGLVAVLSQNSSRFSEEALTTVSVQVFGPSTFEGFHIIIISAVCLPSQAAPASLGCPQLWDPYPWCAQSVIGHVPDNEGCWPRLVQCPVLNVPFFGTNWALPQPSCWQTTWASFSHQLLSHTGPHWPLWKISTLPEQLLLEDYHSQMVMAGCLHRAQRIQNHNMYPSTTLLFV